MPALLPVVLDPARGDCAARAHGQRLLSHQPADLRLAAFRGGAGRVREVRHDDDRKLESLRAVDREQAQLARLPGARQPTLPTFHPGKQRGDPSGRVAACRLGQPLDQPPQPRDAVRAVVGRGVQRQNRCLVEQPRQQLVGGRRERTPVPVAEELVAARDVGKAARVWLDLAVTPCAAFLCAGEAQQLRIRRPPQGGAQHAQHSRAVIRVRQGSEQSLELAPLGMLQRIAAGLHDVRHTVFMKRARVDLDMRQRTHQDGHVRVHEPPRVVLGSQPAGDRLALGAAGLGGPPSGSLRADGPDLDVRRPVVLRAARVHRLVARLEVVLRGIPRREQMLEERIQRRGHFGQRAPVGGQREPRAPLRGHVAYRTVVGRDVGLAKVIDGLLWIPNDEELAGLELRPVGVPRRFAVG